MENIFDYIIWRGDLTFKESPFQEVDGFILSCLSYCVLQEVLTPYDTTPVKISEVANRMKARSNDQQVTRDKKDRYLLHLMGESKRFGDMGLCCYVDHLHHKKETQFAAVTIVMEENELYVSYRGTDQSLIGWKEDFNMTHARIVPSQLAASCYLVYICEKLTGNIRMGGHSKGGNLAVFSAVVAPDSIVDRIQTISTYDGPGFHDGMLSFPGYQKILPRTKAFVPQSSVIGMMLSRQEKYFVVASHEKGLFQHDPYTWLVSGTSFVYLDSVTEGSKFFDRTLKEWSLALPKDKREVFFNTFYEILSKTHGDDNGNLVLSIRNMYVALRKFPYEDEETKAVILEGFGLFYKAFRTTLKGYDLDIQKFRKTQYSHRTYRGDQNDKYRRRKNKRKNKKKYK
ncbi:MAG: Mbeg1-like protein [Bacillota bacterium]